MFRWELALGLPGTHPQKIETSTGKSRDRNAALRAALRGRIQQLRALNSETGTSVLRFTCFLPGQIKETMQWRLTPEMIERLVSQAYRPSRRLPNPSSTPMAGSPE
jgi:hypothetical protein